MGVQQNIARIIKWFMREQGKSIEEFSEELDISKSALVGYLKEKGNPSATTIEHMASKLGIDPAFFVTEKIDLDHLNIALLVCKVSKELAGIPEAKRKRFAELLGEILQLWDDN